MSRSGGGRSPLTAATGAELLYIGGYGRSGSTLLARILAEDERVVDLGEVVRTLPMVRKAGRLCTCGRMIRKCPAWRPVARRVGKAARRGVDEAIHAAALTALAETERWPIIVDASKTARHLRHRPAALKRRLAMKVTLLHLIRDPRAVLWSTLRHAMDERGRVSPARMAVATLRTAAGWTLANLACEGFGRRHRESYVRIRYDEALRDGVPAPLARFIPPGPLDGRRLAGRFDNRHAPAGSGVGREDSVTVAIDEAWRQNLPSSIAGLTVLLCLPLVLRYGFLKRSRPVLAMANGVSK